MPLGAEIEVAVDVLKRFAQQAHDKPMTEASARLGGDLADIEILLSETRRIRAELEIQAADRPFISPWI